MSVLFPASQPVHLDYANVVKIPLAPEITWTAPCDGWLVASGINADRTSKSTIYHAYMYINDVFIAFSYSWYDNSLSDLYSTSLSLPLTKGDVFKLVTKPLATPREGIITFIPYK